MSQENVTALKEWFEQFGRDGTPIFEVLDPEMEVINFDTFPVTRPYYGWDGVVEWLADVSEPFEDFRFELIEILGHDDEQVVTSHRLRGRSQTGGPEFNLFWAAIYTFRDGKIVRAEGFRTPEEALEAAGLSEQDARADS